MGNGGKEQMAHCHDTDIYMSLPGGKQRSFPLQHLPLPFPFPSLPSLSSQALPSRCLVPLFSYLRPSFRQPSSVLFHTTRLFLLPNLLHLSTSPADPAATLSIVLHLSVASNLASRKWTLLHLDRSPIFVCASRPSLRHAPLHNGAYPEP